ncbi:nucleotide exchange factor GrpE [Candidatus Saccharibacteria bacterium]|nr:MAG: nucleotide exchange factor GrpE [Candidatus Saccharibacteria bacterium]
MSKTSKNDASKQPEPENNSQQNDGVMASVELELLQRQVAELTEALQRERADATNIRRRHDEQLANLKSVLQVSVIESLLPVIDNFERALKHVPEDLADNDYIKGVQGVVKQFEQTLQGLGVKRIATVGEPFNPHVHEAVGVDEGDGEEEIVSEELQAGYQLGDTVIRHAMVKVRR